MAFDLKDYVDVAERLREWHERHAETRIVTSIVEHSGTRVTVRAEVYRKLDDAAPAGVGHSSLGIPGTTPYTKGSELENAETSAIGRALVAAGLATKRIASADEVRAHAQPATPYAAETLVLPDTLDEDFAMARDAITFVAAASAAPATNGSTCPKHRQPWKLRDGTSAKTGKEYAFWSCGSKDPDEKRGWCEQRPAKEWEVAQEGRR
jgi:hypothetical protein